MSKVQSKETLKSFQEYVRELEKERGFEKEDVSQRCLLLGEKIGELLKKKQSN